MKRASTNGTSPIYFASDLSMTGGTKFSYCQRCLPELEKKLKSKYEILTNACTLTNTTGPLCGLSEMVALSMSTKKYRLKTSTLHRFAKGEWESFANL